MVFLGTKLAVAVTAKGGPNLLIQTHGIGTRAVQEATSEVAETLKGFIAGQSGLDGTGDKAPGFSMGQLRVAQGRFSVAYRAVGGLYVMVVSPPDANIFLCLQLLDAVAKMLVGVVKGVDVTPDRLAKRYTEVYMLLDELLCGGFATLPHSFVHSSATDARLLSMPASAADAARRFRRMVRGQGAAKSQFVPGGKPGAESSDATPVPVPETPTLAGRHVDAAEADPLAAVVFDIPSDALPPPPPRAAGARPPPAARQPPRPTAAPPAAFKGMLEEDEAAVRAAEAQGRGALGEDAALEASAVVAATHAVATGGDDGWAKFGEAELEPMPMPMEPAVVPPPVPAELQRPVLSPKDVQDSLQLVEVWHAEVAGGRLASAGLEGRVVRKLAPYGLQAACFRLLPSGSAVVDACLRTAAMNRQFTEKQGSAAPSTASEARGVEQPAESQLRFLATFQRASIGCSYLAYTLPAIACTPPLQLHLHAAPGTTPGPSGTWQGLVVLQYAASPRLSGSLLDVVVDLSLPAEAAGLCRVSPAAQWAKEHGRLRWAIPRIPPGAQGLLRAVVTGKPGSSSETAAVSLRRSTAARVRFSLRPSASLSGLSFQVGMPDDGAPLLAGNVQCYGEVTVTC